MAKAKGPAPQPWQVAASATLPPGSALSNTGGARPSEDLLRPAADAGALHPPPAPPAPPPVPTDPKGFQQYLKARGANLGKSGPGKDGVDGIIGPKTLAEAARLGVPVPPELAPPPSPAPAPPPPSAPEPPAPAAAEVAAPQLPASPTANMDDATLAQYFGYGTWVLQIPELKAILDRYATSQTAGTPMTADELRTAVEGSNYFKSTSQTQRDFTKLQTEDPTTAQQRLNAEAAAIQQQAQPLGISIAPDRLQSMATDAIRYGWNQAQLQSAIAAEFHYTAGGQSGAIGADEAHVKALATSYGVANLLDDNTLASYDQQIAAGTATPETIKQQLVTMAQQRYTGIAKQITVDNPTSNLLSPYKAVAQQELGVNPDTIDFSQPMWMKAVNQIDPNTGAAIPMNLADWTKTLRSDPIYGWDNTQNGIATNYQLGNALTSALGTRP